MPELIQILRVLEVLAPLVKETYEYLYNNGKKPEFMTKLPSPMRSEVALAAAKAKQR